MYMHKKYSWSMCKTLVYHGYINREFKVFYTHNVKKEKK